MVMDKSIWEVDTTLALKPAWEVGGLDEVLKLPSELIAVDEPLVA